jgi:hypothetical protein
MCSKFCIPYLRKSSNPHILTISPPLGMSGKNWFAMAGTGYVLAKYGMTLITHGLAGEMVRMCGFEDFLRYGIQNLLHIKVPLVLIDIAKSNCFTAVSSTGV